MEPENHMPQDFQRGLRDFAQRLEKLSEIGDSVPLVQVLSPDFVRQHTKFSTFEEMCEAVGITTAEEFTAFSDEEWERHVRANTSFASWEEMQQAGGQQWFERKWKETGR